jgi:autotransporter-associated beta strand protein
LNVASTTGTAAGGTFYLASRGNGTLIITNTALVECATLDLSRNASAGTTVGTLNLDGGTLLCSKVTTANANTSTNSATGSTATFNFNGGTLKANASSATFFQGGTVATLPTGTPIPITAIVKSGGAVIDTTNFNITVLEPLQHDITLDVTPDGGLIKKGSGALTLSATNSYTGLTTVSNGTLLVNGVVTGDVTVKTNATLGGSGIIGGTVSVQLGGSLAAGAAGIGTVTLSNSPSLNGSVIAQVDRNGGSPLADEVIVGAAIAYNGTLVITNTGAALVAGDTFTLFNATGYSGAFTLLSQTPGQIVTWNTNNLTSSGIIQVATAVPAVSTVPTNIVATVSGDTLTLSWPADHTGWTLQVQTNSLTTGLNTNWFDVAGSITTNLVNTTINPANGSVFYRMVY